MSAIEASQRSVTAKMSTFKGFSEALGRVYTRAVTDKSEEGYTKEFRLAAQNGLKLFEK